ncbi:hypothetical protein LA02_884 [Francisella philomiragia]|uniref:glycosyltransferase family 61 protein n=1 Tax=Francisella philomiragia TaxID=28110 RepID=UPI0005A56473|nr:glycosyltransferase family 61 protein [Francisella philomiragia]AJI57895.1 hypothetical protein LA02_884 [Francisella philomiragia]
MRIIDVVKIVYKFIPKIIREQFLLDPLIALRDAKLRNRLAKTEVQVDMVDTAFSLVSSIEELNCQSKLLFQNIDRSIKVTGPKLVIDSEEFIKSDIYTNLPDVKIYSINNVSVVGNTDVLIKDECFFNYNLSEMDSNHTIKRFNNISLINDKKYSIKFNKSSQKHSSEKIYISLLDDNSRNYYHFVVETIPRFMLVIDILKTNTNFNISDYIFLIDEVTPKQCLELLNIVAGCELDIEIVGESDEFYCDKLIHCSPLSYYLENSNNIPNTFKDCVIDVAALKKIRDSVLSYPNIKAFKKFKCTKIYLPRLGNNWRKLDNNHQLETLMHRKGFEFVNTGTMSFMEQVSLFQHADIIVGPSGASFTNLLFMKAGAKVINISPSSSCMNYTFFQAIADVSNVDMALFLTTPSTEDTTYVHAPSKIDITAFEAYINNILNKL